MGFEYKWGGAIKLGAEVLSEIEYAVEKLMKDKITKSATDFANLINIDKMIENRVIAIIEERIDAGVKQRLKEISEKI